MLRRLASKKAFRPKFGPGNPGNSWKTLNFQGKFENEVSGPDSEASGDENSDFEGPGAHETNFANFEGLGKNLEHFFMIPLFRSQRTLPRWVGGWGSGGEGGGEGQGTGRRGVEDRGPGMGDGRAGRGDAAHEAEGPPPMDLGTVGGIY